MEDGFGEQIAIIYHSEMTGKREQISYRELQKKVSLCAGVIKSQGLVKGDRALIYMPMVSETLVANSVAANPPKTTEWVTPKRAQASIATRVSETIGI